MDARVSEKRLATLAYLGSVLDLGDPAEELLDLLSSGSRLLSAPRGGLICYAEEQPAGCFFIVQGTVKLCLIGQDGTERVLALLEQGCSFGESSIWLGRPDRLCAQAIEESLLLQLGRAAMLRATRAYSEFADALLRCISGQSVRLLNTLYDSSFLNARDRVVHFLLGHATPTAGGDGQTEVRLPACKALTAAALHMTAETFSREIHGLARAGLLTVEHRTIRLHDPARLRGLLADCAAEP